MIFNNKFKSKKVLITGHTGFKGSWLTFWMLKFGAIVYGISDNDDHIYNKYNFKKNKRNLINYKFDINNRNKLIKTVKFIKPDFIFHLAAQSLVFDSYKNPINTFNTNLIGTINLLESIRFLKKCTAVFITSDKCYENLELKRGYKEIDKLGGKDPYSASKASAEIAINCYVNSFFNLNSNIRIATARAGNVIGGGDWNNNRLVPDCMKSWSQDRIVNIRNPNSTRPWQHVLEPLGGYIHLSIKLSENEIFHGQSFNFGPKNKKAYTVAELVDEMAKFWNNVKWKNTSIKNNFFETTLLQLNCNKAKKLLGWESCLNFRKTCDMTINWYKSFYINKNLIDEIFEKQIDDYTKILNEKIK